MRFSHLNTFTSNFAENLKLGSENVALNKTESEDWDLPLVDFKKIVNATDNFSLHNKLGEGGFGLVYKVIIRIFNMCILWKQIITKLHILTIM